MYDTSTGYSVTLPTRYIALGETKTLTNLNLKAVGYSSSTDSATFKWTTSSSLISVNQSTGAVTALTYSESYATITGTCSYGTVQFKVYVLPIQDGTYFLRSRAYNAYMQVNDADEENNYQTSGATIEQWGFDGGNYQQWRFTLLKDGYYSIISENSGLALSVPSGKTGTSDVTLVQEVYSGLDRQKWKITMVSRNLYKIKSKSAESASSDLSVVVGYSDITVVEGVNIQQRVYSDDEVYNDEWYIQPIHLELNTPKIYQTTDSWCWATSAQMLARTLRSNEANNGDYETIRDEQRAAVYHVFGDSSATAETYDWESDPQGLNSKGGSYWNVGNAAAYLTGLENGSTVYSAYASPYSEENLLNFLLDGYPVARLYVWVTYNSDVTVNSVTLPALLEELDPNMNGHVQVIKGVEWKADQGCYLYTVFDPSNGGDTLYCTFSELQFSKVNHTEATKKVEFWFPTVVVKTDYSDETFLSGIFSYDYYSD